MSPASAVAESTYASVTDVLVRQFQVSVERLSPQCALTDLGLDSLALMEFVFAVEDRFEVRIPEEKLDPRQAGLTLGQVCDALDAAKAA